MVVVPSASGRTAIPPSSSRTARCGPGGERRQRLRAAPVPGAERPGADRTREAPPRVIRRSRSRTGRVPSVAVSVRVEPLRRTVRRTCSPGWWPSMAALRASAPSTLVPSTAVMTSPLRRPARSPAPPLVTAATRAPRGVGAELDAEVGVLGLAAAAELGDDPADRARRDREADAGVAGLPGGLAGAALVVGVDLGVDADDGPVGVEQRAARVARVQRRVGLDRVRDREPVRRLDGAVDGRDDAGGQRAVQAVGVADRGRGVADLHLGGVRELQRRDAQAARARSSAARRRSSRPCRRGSRCGSARRRASR